VASLGSRTGIFGLSRERIEKMFPTLAVTGYLIASPEVPDYNCIAWAACDNERWWWPDPQLIGYWPPDAPRLVTLDAFIKAYETLGYTPCQNPENEENFEKIAIYVDPSGKPTHAARQVRSGRWTSKLGELEDIEHTLEGLVGPQYGRIAAVMKRLKQPQ